MRIAAWCFEGGGDFVEVGCFRGGISAQLAALALRFGRKVTVCDINADYLAQTRSAIELVGASNAAGFFQGTLAELAASGSAGNVHGVFIDGDHRYEGVMLDIQAFRSFEKRPRYLAFHDFCLRSNQPGLTTVRVDLAVMDAFKGTAVFRPMGLIAGFDANAPDRSADVYFETGLPEGAWCDFER